MSGSHQQASEKGDYAVIAIGAAVWLGHAAFTQPGPFERGWAVSILLLAPLVLVPLALRLAVSVGEDGQPRLLKVAQRLGLPAAALLVAAFTMPTGRTAALLALPWTAVTLLIAAAGLLRLLDRRNWSFEKVCTGAGMIYLAVGGIGALQACWGMRPLDFKPVIILLTGVHFHYAGFLLPVAAALASARLPGIVGRSTTVLVVGSVPLVGIGITATQLGFDPNLECAAALLMSLGGLGVAVLHGWLSLRGGERLVPRVLWGLAAATLAAAMVLSALYGLRGYHVVAGLDIVWMRATHGTLNALGFGLPCLLGWAIALPFRRKRPCTSRRLCVRMRRGAAHAAPIRGSRLSRKQEPYHDQRPTAD